MKKNQSKLTLGLILIIGGVLLVINKMNIIHFDWSWNEYLPVLISSLGIILLFSHYPNKMTFPFFVFYFGIFWFAYSHDYFYPYYWNHLYPAVFVLIGVAMISAAFFPKPQGGKFFNGLIILIPSGLWLYNRAFMIETYRNEVFMGLFLVLLGAKFVIVYLINQKKEKE